MKKIVYLPVVAWLLVASCNTAKQTVATDNGKIEITIVQINDVYEIAPLDGGKAGGMARVATVKKEQLSKNGNTIMVMAGDFLSTSVYNSLKFEGNRIRGKQMVDAMNVAGVDLAVFGNHEFDIPEADVQSRINESKFFWVSSNTFQKKGNDILPFVKNSLPVPQPFPKAIIRTMTDKDGTSVKIGFIGLTLPFNKAPFVSEANFIFVFDNFFIVSKK